MNIVHTRTIIYCHSELTRRCHRGDELMTYKRVMPRDLFNEANLLKCLGHLVLMIEGRSDYNANIIGSDIEDGWSIQQNETTGGIYADNVLLFIGNKIAMLERPLNSREAWPLSVERLDGIELEETIDVFDSDGNLSELFTKLISFS